jgi:hypothetical protein
MADDASNPRQSAEAIYQCQNIICRFWQHVLELALALWVARVPLTMTGLGLALLGLTPQAQDLFVDLTEDLHYLIEFPIKSENLVRILLALGRTLSFLLLLVFAWALPTHYAARLLLETDERFQGYVRQLRSLQRAKWIEGVERWLPLILGLFTFAAVAIAIGRSGQNIPILDEHEVEASTKRGLWLFVVMEGAAVAAFIYFVCWWHHDQRSVLLRPFRPFARFMAPIFRLTSPGMRHSLGTRGEEDRDVGRLLLLIVFVLFVFILWFGTDLAAEWLPRALAVPLVLGGWLPFLSYWSAVGRQFRVPMIVGLWALTMLIAVVAGDKHSVRRIDATKMVEDPRDLAALPFRDAVTLWMRENRCADTPTNCPRPVIVAAAGGASRAGFFTGTVLGYFLQEAMDHQIDPNDVRRRLFAISGVSGGSVGAVMVAAALNAKQDSSDHPCVQSSFTLWWGDKINYWRDCFEALTSGDFLTPVFIGWAFHDMIPFGPQRDRAAVLEDSWDRRYRNVVTRADPPAGTKSCEGLACPFLSLRPRPGHWIPILVINGTSEAKGNRLVTTVLAPTYLLDNAKDCPNTSRIEIDCRLFAESDHFHDLLNDTTKSDSWLARLQISFRSDFRNQARLNDVTISTAAHNSARFPIISPPGSVRNRAHETVDRIVDGGYVENYGALSALELALAIRAVQPALAPAVLVISNDPDDLLDPQDDFDPPVLRKEMALQQALEQKRRAGVDDSEPLTDIVTPLKTFANTRTARGTLAVAQLRSILHRELPNCSEQVTHIRVWPQSDETNRRSRAVSMSWWLSMPIQRHLHQQTEGTKNENQNEKRLNAVWDVLKGTSACATAPAQ